jgi:uncharacterized membrane protein
MTDDTAYPRERGFGGFLIIAGALGLVASLALSIEKVEKLLNPGAALSCDVSVLVQCSANLDSWQGAVLGFPNPYLGLIGFSLVVGVGVGVWAVPRFARWFWLLFNAGLGAAFVFVGWLISQSIYVLGTLCPWCLVVWSVTIPLLIFVTGRNLRRGVYGEAAARFGEALWPWLTLVVVALFSIVATLAQLRLDVISSLL